MCRVVDLQQAVLAKNDVCAHELRAELAARGTIVVNLLSSPGSGKTALLEQELLLARRRGVPVAALTADLATENDAMRLARSGVPVKQVLTDGLCHLEAGMLGAHLEDWLPEDTRLLFVENVGNLVCPASYDLGESLRVALASVTEGEDKPLKYPTAFGLAQLVVVTKTDIAQAVGFDEAAFRANVQQVNPGVEVVLTSARGGAGAGLLLDRAVAVADGASPHLPVMAARTAGHLHEHGQHGGGELHSHEGGLLHAHPHAHDGDDPRPPADGRGGDLPAGAPVVTAAQPGTAVGEVLRRRVTVRGVVQGVGFRPFVYTLATGLGLAGQVSNTGEGVIAEVEGAPGAVALFCDRIATDAPPLAVVESVDHQELAAAGGSGFAIVASRNGGPARTLVSPDVATCADCLAELADPADRRHRHPFITCTHCGPRFTIVTGLPYDRSHTTMAGFPMCADCAREYADPADRRFHAQPVACHACGPRLVLLPADGVPGDPIAAARALLAEGAILAVKGLGGYHLACDATDSAAVARLRLRKARGDKPFALMARSPEDVEPLVELGAAERELLTGGTRPIVLLRKRYDGSSTVADAVAPGSADLGVMLPYTPLHHLLLGLPGDPPGPRLLVMTSGNLSGEPIVIDDAEALERLAHLADAWLTHDRPIHVPCDDSVLRVCDDAPLMLRRSRGYAPLPVALPVPVRAALAVGGDLKNTFCLAEGRRAWLSAHVGDMDDLATQHAFERAEAQLESITGVRPTLLAADRHPAYRSGRWAQRHRGDRLLAPVQHHHAHIASAMAEHGLDGGRRVIGVAFDGTGYGDDGAVWGGEFLLADYDGYRRFGQLAYVPLPGSDAAVHRPYRMALAHLRAAGLPWTPDLPCVAACPPDELKLLERQLERDLNCVPTSSMGRLFDAVSSLAGVCQLAGYEAQAAIELEAAALVGAGAGALRGDGYAFGLRPGPSGGLCAEPGPVLAAVVADLRAGADRGLVAARFHAAVADLVCRVCAAARAETGLDTVALTGGVFANTVLSSACSAGLARDGFTVLRHRLVPPNDGGLALGQLMVAARWRPGDRPPPVHS